MFAQIWQASGWKVCGLKSEDFNCFVSIFSCSSLKTIKVFDPSPKILLGIVCF